MRLALAQAILTARPRSAGTIQLIIRRPEVDKRTLLSEHLTNQSPIVAAPIARPNRNLNEIAPPGCSRIIKFATFSASIRQDESHGRPPKQYNRGPDSQPLFECAKETRQYERPVRHSNSG